MKTCITGDAHYAAPKWSLVLRVERGTLCASLERETERLFMIRNRLSASRVQRESTISWICFKHHKRNHARCFAQRCTMCVPCVCHVCAKYVEREKRWFVHDQIEQQYSRLRLCFARRLAICCSAEKRPLIIRDEREQHCRQTQTVLRATVSVFTLQKKALACDGREQHCRQTQTVLRTDDLRFAVVRRRGK